MEQFKKDFYVKGIHIKLLWEDNTLTCKIYSYSSNSYFAFYNKNLLLVSEKDSVELKDNLNKQGISNNPIIITQKISFNDILEKEFFLNLYLINDNNEEVYVDTPKNIFTKNVKISFTRTHCEDLS